MNSWMQIYVSGDPDRLKQIEPVLGQFGAAPVAPDGYPVTNEDGVMEVRLFAPSFLLSVTGVLESQGLTVVKTHEHH